MITTLQQTLNLIIEDASEPSDEGAQFATGRTAYRSSERALKLRMRKNEIAQLARELGRDPSPEEIDLVFGDLDESDPMAPLRVEGDYGRTGKSSDDFEVRRQERGPTARRMG